MGGPPTMGGPPMGGPPKMMGGPPSGGGSAMPPPKTSVQFFSVGGGGAAPVPSPASSFGGMPPPPSAMGGPPSGGFAPPAPGSGGPPQGGDYSPGHQQQFQPGMPPGQQQFQQPGQQFQSYSGPPPGNYGAAAPQPMMGVPSGFDAPAYGQQQPMGQPGAAGALPGADAAGGGQVLPGIEDMDLSIQCDPAFLRSSVGKIVSSQAYATKSRLPLGIMCRPMAGDVGIENDQVEVVDFGTTGIVRCKRCRTYINPFVSWVDNGRRWRCNICGMLNDVPTSYFSHLDQNGQRRDKDQRPELSCCSVEFVAPGDYMVRPPQPPVFFFVIDVTSGAGSSGMLQHVVNSVRRSLDNLPGNPRTHVGFITFDSSIHFYNLKSTLKAPQMLVVSDITDVIMPSPEDLLVNLQDSRDIVEALLDSLPAMFQVRLIVLPMQ
jgi:protein transport protein SEC24